MCARTQPRAHARTLEHEHTSSMSPSAFHPPHARFTLLTNRPGKFLRFELIGSGSVASNHVVEVDAKVCRIVLLLCLSPLYISSLLLYLSSLAHANFTSL